MSHDTCPGKERALDRHGRCTYCGLTAAEISARWAAEMEGNVNVSAGVPDAPPLAGEGEVERGKILERLFRIADYYFYGAHVFPRDEREKTARALALSVYEELNLAAMQRPQGGGDEFQRTRGDEPTRWLPGDEEVSKAADKMIRDVQARADAETPRQPIRREQERAGGGHIAGDVLALLLSLQSAASPDVAGTRDAILALVAPRQGEWISVKDRLPEGECDVLVSIGHGWVQSADFLTWDGEHEFQDEHDCRLRDVTHWMKKPAPPTDAPKTQGRG